MCTCGLQQYSLIVLCLHLHVSFSFRAGECHDDFHLPAPTRRLESIQLTFGKEGDNAKAAHGCQSQLEGGRVSHLQTSAREKENDSTIHARPPQSGRKGMLQLAELSVLSNTASVTCPHVLDFLPVLAG